MAAPAKFRDPFRVKQHAAGARVGRVGWITWCLDSVGYAIAWLLKITTVLRERHAPVSDIDMYSILRLSVGD